MEQESATFAQTTKFDTSVDVMAERPLHRIMLLLNQPAYWSNVRAAATLLLLAALPAAFWLLLGQPVSGALWLAGLLLLFFAGDLLVLFALPRLRISFGPWQPQLFELAVLRALGAAVIGLLAALSSWAWALPLLLAIQLVGTAALVWAALIEPAQVRLTRLAVQSDHLDPTAHPIRLLHITDLHIEHLSRREGQILDMVAREEPHLILLTGDYVNLSYNEDEHAYRRIKNFLAQLSAPGGVYATLGTPTVDLRQHLIPMFAELSLHLLRKESRLVELPGGQRLTLLGMDCTHHLQADAAALHEVVQTVEPDGARILLYHSPEIMAQATAVGVDLYLCGHTHGGQLRLPFLGPLLTSSHLGRKYVMGLYREGHTHLYVSRGVGLEGLSAPRVRLLCPPEITLITLTGTPS
jgi:predicted MPP superfamily phosphohydrolase